MSKDSVEDLGSSLGYAAHPGEPSEAELFLSNRADGIDGHYCIARRVGKVIEYWNKGEFSAFGEVFKSRVEADAQMRKLRGQSGKLVAVLRRFIPVESPSTDTLTYLCNRRTTVEEIMEWAEWNCRGSAAMVSLELVRSA